MFLRKTRKCLYGVILQGSLGESCLLLVTGELFLFLIIFFFSSSHHYRHQSYDLKIKNNEGKQKAKVMEVHHYLKMIFGQC